MINKTTFKRNVISHAGGTAIGLVAQLALVTILGRFLSVADFAVYLTAAAMVAIGEMASDFGARIWSVKGFSTSDKWYQIFRSAFLTKTIFSLIMGVIVMALPRGLLSFNQLILSLLIAFLQPSTDPFLWFLRGREKIDIEALVTLIWRITNAVLLAAVAFAGKDINLILAIWLGSNITRMLLETRISEVKKIFTSSGNGAEDEFRVIQIMKASFPIGASFLLISIYNRLGVLGLGYLGAEHDVAIYGAAFTLVASAGFVANSITISSFPQLAQAIKNNDPDTIKNIVSSKLKLISVIFIPSCVVGLFVSPLAIRILYGNKFPESGNVMALLMSGLFISSINVALKYLLNGIGKNWADAFSAVLGISVFALMFIFYKGLPVYQTAAIAWGAGEFTSFIFKSIIISRTKNVGGVNYAFIAISYISLLLFPFFF